MDILLELNLAALVFLFPFIHTGSGRLFNSLWGTFILIWAVRKIVLRDRMQIPAALPLLGVLAGTIVVSSLLSEAPALKMKGFSYVLNGIALFPAVYDFALVREKFRERMLLYLLAATTLVGLDALIQVVSGRDLLGIPLSVSRATAFFIHPFYVALWSGIGICIALSLFMRSAGKKDQVLAAACLVVLSAAFLFSKTRAAWIAMAGMLLFMVLSLPDKKRFLKILIPGLMLPVILILADPALRARVFSVFSPADPRFQIWRQSWTMTTEKFTLKNWVIGRGPGMFKTEYPEYDLIRGGETFPHMIGMELFYAAGILGIIAFVAWVVRYGIGMLSARAFSPGNGYRACVACIPFLVLAICFINESFFSRYFSFLFWFTAGFAAAFVRDNPAGHPAPGVIS